VACAEKERRGLSSPWKLDSVGVGIEETTSTSTKINFFPKSVF
jgi:hypothetical protein